MKKHASQLTKPRWQTRSETKHAAPSYGGRPGRSGGRGRREHEALSVSGDERTWTAKARPGSHVAGKAVLGKQQTRFVLNILNLHPLRNPSRGLLRKVRARHMDVGDGSLRMKF